MLFFYKQKTAYEMCISDWSSDVCSSDLFAKRDLVGRAAPAPGAVIAHQPVAQRLFGRALDHRVYRGAHPQPARIDAVRPVLGGFAEPVDQLAPHVFDEPASHPVRPDLIGTDRAQRLGRSEARREG